MRANAKGTRNRAAAQATALQKAAQDNQLLAAENLTTAQSNKRAAEATLRTSQVYSGFDTGKDSGTQAMANLQQQLDAEIANMERAASINLLNSWQKATDIRSQAELEAYAQEAQANQYAMAAKYSRQGSFLSLVSGALNAMYGFSQGYNSATTHNTNQFNLLNQLDAQALTNLNEGKITQAQYDAILAQNASNYMQNVVSPTSLGFSAASQAGNSAFHFVNSFNPYTGALSADANNRKNNWGGVFSVLSGNVPYKIPAAGTIFAQY